MATKRWWAGTLLAALAFSTGCCAFADRWCPNRRPATCCCVPCTSAAPVVAAAPPPATGWNTPTTMQCTCTQTPVAVPAR